MPFAHALSVSQTQENGVRGSELKALSIREVPHQVALSHSEALGGEEAEARYCLDFSLNAHESQRTLGQSRTLEEELGT